MAQESGFEERTLTLEILATFRLLILLMLLPLFFAWRMLKKGPVSHLTALLLKEVIMGIWHRLFGAKKVQIAKRRCKNRQRWS